MFNKPSPAPSAADSKLKPMHDEVETVVGPSVNVEGDFSSEGNIIVKGTVAGSVKTSKMLTVEEGAKIVANVRAGNAVISGDVRGNVKIGDRLELKASAKVAGDIECKILAVDAGALLSGKVMMKGLETEEKKVGQEIFGGKLSEKK